MKTAVLALLLGIVVACTRHEQHCDDFVCDDCRSCAAVSVHACGEAWDACDRDPACTDLAACFDGCLGVALEYRVSCESECHGTFPDGLGLYEQAMSCLDAVCAQRCE
jgi:hypothetical protein